MGKKKILVGGQAVIEGVMMRAPGAYATAVRRANGEIQTDVKEFESILVRRPRLNKPLLRGIISLFETLKIGIGSLQWSADIAMEDEEEKEGEKQGKPGKLATAASLFFAFVVGIGAFFVLPLLLTTKLFDIESSALPFNAASGAIRIIVFLIYIWGISRIEDIKRVFQYHGAEHRMVFTFENGCKLLPAESIRFSRFHPRCGTSFLLIVMLSAIIVFAVIDTILIGFIGTISLRMRLLFHLPLIPLVMGIGYEAIKLSGKYSNSRIGRILVAPGLWLQRLTTGEPDDSQLEVAAEALKAALGDKYDEYLGEKFEAETVQ